MKHLVIVFCEGPHDVAFLTRILKCACYKTYNEQIKNYPHPLSGIFSGALSNMKFAELKLDQVSSKLLPRKILKKGEQIVLLFALGGNRQFDRATQLLETFNDISGLIQNADNSSEIGRIGEIPDLKLSYIFFNDADQDINTELGKLNSFLKNFLDDANFNLKHNHKVNYKGYEYGAYFFSSDGHTGTLEDLLLDIMKDKNETIFSKSTDFYTEHGYSPGTKKLKISFSGGAPIETRSGDPFNVYPKKSIITIAGQLQNSGKSQVTIIEDTDYITLEKIMGYPKTKEIIDFFNCI